MKKLLICTLALALSGCAGMNRPTVWDHRSRNATQFEEDKTQCYYQAKMQTATAPQPGMRTAIGEEFSRMMQTNDIAEYCMQAKGYVKRPG